MNRRSFLQQAAVATAATLFAGTPLSARAQTASSRRPNILFCIADDASQPHFSAYGCKWVSTPAFDRVAKGGVLFTQAYTPSAKCAPSRACILTGRNTWQLEEAANHWCYFPAKFTTWMETLESAGYFTGFTGKGWAPGIAQAADGQPRSLTCKAWQKRKTPPPTTGISGCDYAANFEDFLAARPAGSPFCFWYGGTEPHRKYEFGSGVAKGGRTPADVDRVPAYWPDNETVRTDMLDYAYEIEHFDRHLGRMLDLLEKQGELANTLVVVTSDNGMPFPRSKGQSYEISSHMPLAIMWPGGVQDAGRVSAELVSFIDFAPTFLEVAGVDQKSNKMQPITGRSLTGLLRNSHSRHRDHVLLAKERYDVGRPKDQGYPLRGILKDGWLYLANLAPERWPGGNPETGYLEVDSGPTKTAVIQSRHDASTKKYWDLAFGMRGGEELYNIKNDPDCLENLAGREECQQIRKELKEQLFSELKAQGDPRVVGGGEKFDAYPYANENQRNYYERYMAGEIQSKSQDIDLLEPGLVPKIQPGTASGGKKAKRGKKARNRKTQ